MRIRESMIGSTSSQTTTNILIKLLRTLLRNNVLQRIFKEEINLLGLLSTLYSLLRMLSSIRLRSLLFIKKIR